MFQKKSKFIESEKLLEEKLGDQVKKLGGWTIKLFPMYIAGLPDRLCLLPEGRLFFAEIKTTDKEATPRQKAIHVKIRKLGFRVEVIDTSEQIFEIMKNF